MKPKLLLRIAVVFTFLYAAGHFMGHFTRKQTTDPVDKEVIRQMEQNKFNVFGSMRSWDNFYEAVSLDAGIALVVFAVLFWTFSNAVDKNPRLVHNLLWPVLFGFIGFTVTKALYVYMIPTVISLLTCLVILTAIIQIRKHPNFQLHND